MKTVEIEATPGTAWVKPYQQITETVLTKSLIVEMLAFCECGGHIAVHLDGVGPVGTVSGIPCDGCDRTHTLQWGVQHEG